MLTDFSGNAQSSGEVVNLNKRRNNIRTIREKNHEKKVINRSNNEPTDSGKSKQKQIAERVIDDPGGNSDLTRKAVNNMDTEKDSDSTKSKQQKQAEQKKKKLSASQKTQAASLPGAKIIKKYWWAFALLIGFLTYQYN